MASRTSRKEISKGDALSELKRDFERRIHEISADLREGRSAAAEESLDYLKNELERMLSDLRQQLDESVEPGREAIRERPLVALGVALGVGVLLGVLLGRKSKE